MDRLAASMEEAEGILSDIARMIGKDASEIGTLRHTASKQISVIDVVTAVTGKHPRHAADDLRTVLTKYPNVALKLVQLKFPGRGQRDTPVASLETMVEIIMLLPGAAAARVRYFACKLLVRYLGGDLNLIEEVQQLHHVQAELRARVGI